MVQEPTGMKDRIAATLISVRDVAAMLDCSIRHIYRLADSGRMPSPVRVGNLVRWQRQVIEDWVRSGCKPIRQMGRA